MGSTLDTEAMPLAHAANYRRDDETSLKDSGCARVGCADAAHP
jgi:hypothetical protein